MSAPEQPVDRASEDELRSGPVVIDDVRVAMGEDGWVTVKNLRVGAPLPPLDPPDVRDGLAAALSDEFDLGCQGDPRCFEESADALLAALSARGLEVAPAPRTVIHKGRYGEPDTAHQPETPCPICDFGEPDPEYMCPRCVTPWKCNGPHIPQGDESREMLHRLWWAVGTDDEKPALIATGDYLTGRASGRSGR